MKENFILEKSKNFALQIIKLANILMDKHDYILSKQIFKSGTSIGANISEGIVAQSKKDFLSKFSIAYKEAQETVYWLELLKDSNFMNIKNSREGLLDGLLKDIFVIVKVLNRIVHKTRLNLKRDF